MKETFHRGIRSFLDSKFPRMLLERGVEKRKYGLEYFRYVKLSELEAHDFFFIKQFKYY